jgi:hypothetical protein
MDKIRLTPYVINIRLKIIKGIIQQVRIVVNVKESSNNEINKKLKMSANVLLSNQQ